MKVNYPLVMDMDIGTSIEKEYQLSLDEIETKLSPGVKNLLCTYGSGIWPSETHKSAITTNNDSDQHGQLDDNVNIESGSLQMRHNFLVEDGLLDIEKCVYYALTLNEDSHKDYSYYARAAFKLSSTFKGCEMYWSQKTLEEFSCHCQKYLQWTGKQQIFLDCFEILTERSESRNILALLLLSTVIEQCIRNVFVLENKQCPLLLKDILASTEIEKCIGKAATQLLEILLGPPISMNIRNIAWHGFLCEGEISPRYAYFLLTFMASLGSQLTSKRIFDLSTTTRQYFPLCKVDCIQNRLQADFHEVALDKIKDFVLNSWVAGAKNKGMIQDVFELHAQKRCGFSSMQGFPILECALRHLFVGVNKCPHRLMTAEATTLYTTYEEILDCLLPGGQKNQLIRHLGVPFMDLLHDLLIYPNGPRARDRLGHGEADVYNIPVSLSLIIIMCLCYVAAKGRARDDLVPQCVQEVITLVDNYESQFHPVSELKEKILKLSQKSSHIHQCLRTDPELQPWCYENIQHHIFTDNNCTFHSIVPFVCDLLCLTENHNLWDVTEMRSKLEVPFENVHNSITEALRPRVSTLHRWQTRAKCQVSNISESEIISLMHRIIAEMSSVLNQMETAIQQRQEMLDNRLLRSRQRDNTKRLVKLLPNTILGVNYLIILCTWLFRLMNQPEDLSPRFKKIQRFLKTTLQLVENLRTSTSKDHNKWVKADELLVTLAQNGVEFVQGLGV